RFPVHYPGRVCERVLQSQNWKVQSLLQRSSEQHQELPNCAEGTERALASAICMPLRKQGSRFAYPGKKHLQCRLNCAEISICNLIGEGALESMQKFEVSQALLFLNGLFHHRLLPVATHVPSSSRLHFAMTTTPTAERRIGAGRQGIP